jgi:hypothetical protein
MNNIKQYFNCGTINETNNLVRFVVNKFEDIDKLIIPVFDKYPLQSSKLLDFKKYKEVLFLMKNKNHLNQDGLDQILLIKYGNNKKVRKK